MTSSMNLGVVIINNQRYMAILHFKNEDGTDRAIRDVAEDVMERLNALVKDYSQPSILQEVSREGFWTQGQEPIVYTAPQQKAWRAFLRALDIHPTEMPEITGHEHEISHGILVKFEAVEESPEVVDLNDREVNFLRTRRTPLKNLAEGVFNADELNTLEALAELRKR